MKRIAVILAIFAFFGVSAVWSQSASYLDSVYQTQTVQYEEAQDQSDPIETLKNEIYEMYQIEMVDDPATNRWSVDWLGYVKQVLATLPKDFVGATKMITLDPGFLPYEVKYNGFDLREGEVMMGYGSIVPSNVYLKKFQAVYNRFPSESEKIGRFKSILLRGMTYAFLQVNPDIAKKWSQVYVAGQIPVKVYGPGQDQNMVVAPNMGLPMVDMAFSVAMYCGNSSELKSRSSARFDYIKENVMSGKSVSGWTDVVIDDSAGNNGNTGNTGNTGTVEVPGSRPPPDIPDGDYLPIVTEVDVGTAAATIPQEQRNAPEELKSAIVELFAELPKFFSTCTEAITYLPTTDTEAAFSSEGYIFITQNSWFAPSFVELTDESRSSRFKRLLVREMTKRFLYFHPEVSKKWQETFIPNQSMFEVYVDLCEATILYYQNPQWLKDLNPERYSFIKSELMEGKEF